MTEAPTKEGTIPYKIPGVEKECFTWYKTVGDLDSGIPPLIMVHGGVGCGHNYFKRFAELWTRYRIPIVFYDQIGCGKSTRMKEYFEDRSFWSLDLFVNELNNLIDNLGIRKGYSLLGHSWGGIVVPEMVIRQPPGLKRLVLASAIASKQAGAESFQEIRKELPKKYQEAINEAVETDNFEGEIFKEMFAYFMRNYLCRSANPPPEYYESQAIKGEFAPVAKLLMGANPFKYVGGILDGWTSVPGLHKITAPTLVFNGGYDSSSRDMAQIPFFENIPRVRWMKFEEAGHMPWMESDELKEKVLKLVGEFLTQDSESPKTNRAAVNGHA